MKKSLEEMTLEELWQLFPIFLTENNPKWKDWYNEEEQVLINLIPKESLVRISHIGSTSIDSIWAKPIIDIMVEVADKSDFKNIKNTLTENSYICMRETDDRISFNKGYTVDGFAEKVFHIHLRKVGDNKELYFRDYLNENLDVAKDYEKLKLSLWKQYENNRDGYTDSKSDFIDKYTKKAKEKYLNTYE